MGAVLRNAIGSFCECSGSRGVRSRELFDETAQWFASSDLDWPFAFESICVALAIDPDWIRRLLRDWLDAAGSRQQGTVRIPRLYLASRRRPLATLTSARKEPHHLYIA